MKYCQNRAIFGKRYLWLGGTIIQKENYDQSVGKIDFTSRNPFNKRVLNILKGHCNQLRSPSSYWRSPTTVIAAVSVLRIRCPNFTGIKPLSVASRTSP